MCGALPCDKTDCTHGEAHRAACEARHVMRWPKERRKSFYAMVKKARGDKAAEKLVADVSDEWRKANK